MLYRSLLLNTLARHAIFSALMLLSAHAFAGEESVSLEYRAPAQCPDRTLFEREVRARTAKVKFGSGGRHFAVDVEKGEAGYVGVLSIREGDAPPSERRFDGKACDEVVSALALVAALAVDPEASTVPRSELTLAPETTPEVAPVPKALPESKPRERVVPEPPRQKNKIEPHAEPLHARAGLNLSMISGPSSELLFAGGPGFELSRRTVLGESSLRVSFLAAQSGVVGPEASEARFRLLVARVALCPLGNAGSLFYRVCAASDAGVLAVRGTDIAVSESATRAWVSAGPMAVVGYDLGSRFYVEASGGAFANLTRDHFKFTAPPIERSVYDVPFASFFAGVGAGVKIP